MSWKWLPGLARKKQPVNKLKKENLFPGTRTKHFLIRLRVLAVANKCIFMLTLVQQLVDISLTTYNHCWALQQQHYDGAVAFVNLASAIFSKLKELIVWWFYSLTDDQCHTLGSSHKYFIVFSVSQCHSIQLFNRIVLARDQYHTHLVHLIILILFSIGQCHVTSVTPQPGFDNLLNSRMASEDLEL